MTRIATMAVAVVVFVVGTLLGFRLLVSGTEAAPAPPTCRADVVKAGDRIDSNLVTVNVFNSSQRSGLANRVGIDLAKNGFREGEIANSTSKTRPSRVAILTSDRKDPRVRLVAAQFKDKVTYAPLDVTVGDGITVVVGNNYRGLKVKPRTSIKTRQDIEVCVPVVALG